jgi:citrate lyase beta subunit
MRRRTTLAAYLNGPVGSSKDTSITRSSSLGPAATKTCIPCSCSNSEIIALGTAASSIRNLRQLDKQLRDGRLGFGSRWAIHPAQVPVINQVFTPTPEQLEAARRLVERFDGALDQGVGVGVDEDGKMVDEAVVRAARRILARARRTAEKSGLL